MADNAGHNIRSLILYTFSRARRSLDLSAYLNQTQYVFLLILAVVLSRLLTRYHHLEPVTLGGAVLFLLFGFVYAHEAYTWQPSEELNELLKSGVRTGADLVKQVALPAE
jgi:hypothetical protein